MKFCLTLNNLLEELHLLKHTFYQSWNEGTLTLDTLKIYAKEYYHHVAAFPRYISQIHSFCPDISDRQVLLENLIDEEKGENNHPELSTTKELVEGYFELVKTDYATGLGALYAYERQTPEVSKSKIDGLKKHYSVCDEKTLEFFSIHQTADEWHTEELIGLIDRLSKSEQEKVAHGAMKGARLLWSFLDGMAECHAN